MARINKNEVKKAEKKASVDNLGIKEESEKGELFFKIVLIIMAVALVSVVLYFVIDAIISSGQNEDEFRYKNSNYVTVADITKISNRENFENLTHEGLKYTLDNYAYVYVLFYSENDTSAWQPDTLDIVDELFNVSSVKQVTFNDFEFTVISDDAAIFFVNVDDPANETWADIVDVSDGQASRATIPVLLEVFNGEDLSWFGPYASAGKNKPASEKLEEVLNTLK